MFLQARQPQPHPDRSKPKRFVACPTLTAPHSQSGGSNRYICRVISGAWVEVVALVAAFAIAVITTPAGVSGAVLLLPFQVSVLGTPSRR